MPFPMQLDGRTYAAPPDLAIAVLDAARAGQFPERRLARARKDDSLSRDEAVGLCAALVETQEPAAVACGARFAMMLGDPALSRLLTIAAQVLDVGALLATTDDDGTSVEDLLLTSAAALLGPDPDVRTSLLVRLRNAGLATAEVRVLATRATPAEIAHHLPAVLLEGLPPGSAEWLADGLAREPEVADALLDALDGLSTAERAAVWAAVAKKGVHRGRPTIEGRLLGRPEADRS